MTDPTGLDTKTPQPRWRPDAKTSFDIIIIASTDFSDPYKTGIATYQKNHPSCPILLVAKATEVRAAVKRQYDNVNKGKANPRKLKVLIIDHGDPDLGPLVGPDGELLIDLASADPSVDFKNTSDADLTDKLSKTEIAGLKDMVSELVFTNCSIAKTDFGKRMLSVLILKQAYSLIA